MLRRAFLISAAALVAGCHDQPMLGQMEPLFDAEDLTKRFQALADKAKPGLLGVAVRDAQTGQTVAFNGDNRFPLQSVFKAALGAAVLAEVDTGKLRLDETISIRDIDLSPPFSPVADAWPARTDYTVAELLERAVGASDNTAADVLMKKIGGPGALTAWLVLKNVKDFQIDRYERQLQPDIGGLASFRADWKGEAAYRAALMAVPEAKRRAAAAAYLADPRDTATPIAAITFLEALRSGQLISKASRRLLGDHDRQPRRARNGSSAAMSSSTTLAHVTGTARAPT
jgi:beta-lactamase class A